MLYFKSVFFHLGNNLFLKFALVAIAIATVIRVFLVYSYISRVDQSGVAVTELLINGLRIDVAWVCQWLALPFLVTIVANFMHHHIRGYISGLVKAWLFLGLIMLVFLEAATPTFISEFDVRPNRLFIEYLDSPREVGSMLLKGFAWQVVMGLAFTFVSGLFVWKLFSAQSAEPQKDNSLRQAFVKCTVMIASIPLLVLGGRSGLQHRPINPAMVALSNDRLVNSLALNSLYSVLYAAYKMSDDSKGAKMYGFMEVKEAIGLVREDIGGESVFLKNSISRVLNPISALAEKDLLIVVLESHGANFVESLGGLPVSPNIEDWRHKSWFFDQLYATGIRSARGLEAIVSGFPPTPSTSVLERPKAQGGFSTLASVLSAYGYTSTFVYGGESHFDNMRGFFLNNGFDNVVDQYDYEAPKFKGSWGVSDEDLFDEVLKLLKKPAKQKRFTLAFTSSNHPPYEYPSSSIEPYGDSVASAANSAKYADFALGKFLNQLKENAFLENLVVLVVADHEDKVFGNDPVPYEKFRIPGFIIAPDIPHKIDDRIVSQIDLAPTLLSLLGIGAHIPFPGIDLTNQHLGNRAIMQFGENTAYLSKHGICYLQPEKSPYTTPFTELNVSDHCTKALAYQTWADHTYTNEAYQILKEMEDIQLSRVKLKK